MDHQLLIYHYPFVARLSFQYFLISKLLGLKNIFKVNAISFPFFSTLRNPLKSYSIHPANPFNPSNPAQFRIQRHENP